MNGLNCESKRKYKKIVITILTTVLITAVVCFSAFAIFVINIPGMYEVIKLNFFVDLNFYGEKSDSGITDGLLSGYIGGLDDKYAQYLTVDESSDRTNRLNGVAQGLGITVLKDINSEFIYIARVFDNSPAIKSGLINGDRIVNIDGQSVSDIGYSKALNIIPRDIGDKVKLTVLRDKNYLDFEIEYSDIVQQTVFYEKIQDYGYIEITSFNTATVEQFYNALNQLQSENVKGLIFDLRDNGGGTVDSVGKILDRLLPKGDLMTVKYKNGNTRVMLRSDEKETNLPMTVLVNKNTASASEVFASNIREFKKGILIGEKTFGKGIMQDTFRLSKGSSVVFTVAELFTHNMTSYHGIGLVPDINVQSSGNTRYFTGITSDNTVLKAVEWLDGEIGE